MSVYTTLRMFIGAINYYNKKILRCILNKVTIK